MTYPTSTVGRRVLPALAGLAPAAGPGGAAKPLLETELASTVKTVTSFIKS